jgi:glycerophosphoryl diester phosphodiesterase
MKDGATRRAPKRVGHKGADLIAPGNTTASFAAALDAGVDMIEFDVLPEHRDGSGRLLIAHDYEHVEDALALDEGLAHLCHDSYAGIELNVDLKLPGYEERVVEALRGHGLIERSLASTMEIESLPILRALAPELRLGWSVPRVRRNYLASRATRPLALAVIARLRRTLPQLLAEAVRDGRIDAAMAHHSVVTPRFVAAMREAGGELYAWTVDSAERIEALTAMGVDGIISNDPRLLDGLRS